MFLLDNVSEKSSRKCLPWEQKSLSFSMKIQPWAEENLGLRIEVLEQTIWKGTL